MNRIYNFFKEIQFIFNILFTGKLFVIFNRRKYKKDIGKQSILTFNIEGVDVDDVDGFLNWLEKNKIDYINRRWTIYLPPQTNLKKCFNFIESHYPAGSSFKILKDFNRPEKAKYSHPKLMNPNGLLLPKIIAHGPISLIRVANYLYYNNVGVRLYDLIAIRFKNIYLSCYIVKHISGKEIQKSNYDSFINKIKNILLKREIVTVTGTNKKAYTGKKTDFRPLNCNNNLLVNNKNGNEYFVDFQGFILRNENKLIDSIVSEFDKHIKYPNKVQRKYIYEKIPGLTLGKSNLVRNDDIFESMLNEQNRSFGKSIVFDTSCNTGLRIYNALSKGAFWAYGWDQSYKINGAEKLLFALGATRFKLFNEKELLNTKNIMEISQAAVNFNCILFMTHKDTYINKQILDLPWEFMFYGCNKSEENTEHKTEHFEINNLKLLSRRNIQNNRTIIYLYKR